VAKQATALASKYPLEKTLRNIQMFMDSVSEGKDSTTKISDATDSATIDPKELEAIETAANMFAENGELPMAMAELDAERATLSLRDALRDL
jgi:hypothetical protein